jgi:CrcB protein
MDYLAIAIGSALGGILRWEISLRLNSDLPWGTLLVNGLGSFMAGLIAAVLIHKLPNDTFRLLLLIGFCGGFTTFSTFSLEAVNLLRSGLIINALAYAFSSLAVCLGLAWLGYLVYEKLSSI